MCVDGWVSGVDRVIESVCVGVSMYVCVYVSTLFMRIFMCERNRENLLSFVKKIQNEIENERIERLKVSG